jgi:hypothetical protein
MSAYKGQRGPNVSQYIANLNQLSPQQDLLADPAPTEDFSDFLNGEFFDVDNARNASVDFASASAFGLDFDTEQTQPLKTDGEFPRNPGTSADANMDFNLNGKHISMFKTVPFFSQCGCYPSRLVRLNCCMVRITPSNSRLARRMQTPPCVLHASSPHTSYNSHSQGVLYMQPCITAST